MRGRELRSGCYGGDPGQVQHIHPSTAAVHNKHADCSIHKKKSYHYHQRFSRYRRFNFAPILGLIAHLVLRCAKKTWLQALLCKSYNATYRFVADINSEKIIRNFNVILILFSLLTYNSRKGYVRSELSLVSCDQPSLV